MVNVYEIITDQIISQLEKGVVPWHKPWNSAGVEPTNLVSKKAYRGINTFLLNAMSYSSPYWLTYNQCTEMGGHVNKGEKSSMVVFYKLNTYSQEGEGGEITEKHIQFLRYYNVFNIEQCELPEGKSPTMTTRPEVPIIEACEKIVHSMPLKPEVKHGGSRACYFPFLDYINMPRKDFFDGSEEYYSTLFHELTHSTGHTKRVGRKNVEGAGDWSAFGSAPYAQEELVAEMGAAFLCGHAGIVNKTVDNSAAYIGSWLRKLKNDKKMVIYAASQAQKAADFVLNK